MSEQTTVSEVWYACVEQDQRKIWTCQGPYNTAQLADDFFKERLNIHKTMLVNVPIYLPPFIRERTVRNYILEKTQPAIFFTKPTSTAPPIIPIIKSQDEWVAH